MQMQARIFGRRKGMQRLVHFVIRLLSTTDRLYFKGQMQQNLGNFSFVEKPL